MVVGRLVKVSKEGSTIHMYLRVGGEKLKVTVTDFRPYFYVLDPDGEYLSIFGEKLRKVYVSDPSEVPKVRSFYQKHYEADVPYVRRFMIDTNITSYVEVPSLLVDTKQVRPAEGNQLLRLWYIDIEVGSDVLPSANNPIHPIVAISVYDTFIKKYVTFVLAGTEKVQREGDWFKLYFADELSMLKSFSKFFNKADPDVLIGWNVNFDVSYLSARFKKLGLDFSFDSCESFDLLTAFRNLYRRPSYKLKAIAMEEGLVPPNMPLSYRQSMSVEELALYSKYDVYYLVKIDEKYRLFDFYLNLKEEVGLPHFEDTYYHSVLIDTALLRVAKRMGYVLPSKPEDVVEESYEGAIVFEAPKGLYSNVAVLDMATYYPSIIMTFNISPETVTSDYGYVTPTGLKFRKDKVGLYPTLCQMWLKYRMKLEEQLATLTPGSEEYKLLKAKRDAIKYLINAIYGYLAFSKSRTYDKRLAETVTAIGREGLLKVKEVSENMGYKVLYGDTDSIMIQVPLDGVQQLLNKLNEELRKHFVEKYNLENPHFTIKFELYADKVLFFGVKKRYAMHVVYEKGNKCDYIKVAGLEAVRSDQSSFSRQLQMKLLEIILKGASLEEVINCVRASYEEIKKSSLLDIAISKGIEKPLDKYKVKPPHVRAAIWSNLNLGTNFKHGDRIYYVWVKRVPKYPQTDVVAFDEETLDRLPPLEIDWEKMIDVNIKQKVRPILEVFNVDVDSLLPVKSSLSRWF